MKYILILIIVINTSFINTTQKYWIGHADVKYKKNASKPKNKNKYWSATEVIEALSEKDAIEKFKKYIIKQEGACDPAQGGEWFYINEIRKEDIIK